MALYRGKADPVFRCNTVHRVCCTMHHVHPRAEPTADLDANPGTYSVLGYTLENNTYALNMLTFTLADYP